MSPGRPLVSLLLLLAWPATGCFTDGNDQDDVSAGHSPMAEPTEADSNDDGPCFEPPHCDPLSSECASGEICGANLGTFDCMVVPADTDLQGEGEECGTMSCNDGLVCVATAVPGCDGGQGCCLPLCDLEQPQCVGGRVCVPYYPEGSSQCYAHVGVCEPG